MTTRDFQDILEADAPTVATFFRGEQHWSSPPDADDAMIAATEERLDVALPSLLKALYLLQNGGSSDFAFSAISPDAPLAPGSDFFDHWRASLPDDALLPVSELTSMTELQATFDHDPDGSWREHLPGADRLIRIGQHAWDEYLCLDYSDGLGEPKVVLFNDIHWEPGSKTPFEIVWPDFEAFFSGLRRLTLREEEGMLYRGINPAGPRDQRGGVE